MRSSCTRRRRRARLIALAALAASLTLPISVRPALGGDLYTLFDGTCRRTTGVLVHVDEDRILVLEMSGRLARMPRDQVGSLVLHNLLENPLYEISLDREFKSYLRDVWVGDDDEASFTGWPTSFFDDLLIFTDIEGKTHVVDPADISRMVDTSIGVSQLRPQVHARPNLGFPAQLVPCAAQTPIAGALPPSRVIADRIKLGDHFAKLKESYQAIDEFEERTRVYARPFVFDDSSRVGLFFHQDMPLPIPFYFRWSSGRPYRFQSRTVLGNTIHDWLPFTTPTLSLTSDAKSHFFNATFVGNILALPAGTNAFRAKEEEGFDDDPFGQGPDEPETDKRLGVDVSYNYLILMGADYWRLSVSAGPAYLSTRIETPSTRMEPAQPLEARRIDAEKLSPSLRVRYQGAHIDLRALYFNTRLSGKRTENEFDEMGNAIEPGRFKLRSDALRLGATLTIFREVEIALDQIFTLGKYSERDNEQPLSLSYFYSDSNAQVSSDFGRFVTVRGYARVLSRRHSVKLPTIFGNDNRTEMRFGAALEFVF